MRHAPALAAALTACCAAHAGAVVVLPASRDNTMFAEGTLSNGAGIHLFTGTTLQNQARRALLHFDVASALPAGAVITSVTLTLHMSRTAAATEPVDLRRALAAWGEGASDAPGEEGTGAPAEPGDATWRDAFFPGTPWATLGGDFDPVVSASALVTGNGFYAWSDAGMIADVQAWIDNPADNFGWGVIGNEAFDTTAKRFDSREHPDPARRPSLTVAYVPAPSAATALALGAALLPRRRRRASQT